MDLVTKFSKHVDERFSAESRSSLLAKAPFDFTGANQIAVWKVTTAPMSDYLRSDEEGENGKKVKTQINSGKSLYGEIDKLDAGATLYTLEKDRSFTFVIDRLDLDETAGMLKAGEDDYVQNEIHLLKQAVGNKILKVIIETCLLTDEEKVRVCKLAKEAGADFVKTSTGFSKGGATVEDVRLMRETVGPEMGVKASGGVRTHEDLLAMVEAGANRIGTSNGTKII